MNPQLIRFAARLEQFLDRSPNATCLAAEPAWDEQFAALAAELFALQFAGNPAYRSLCESRRFTPKNGLHWADIPHAPTNVFKELELSCLPAEVRTAVFHSSGTTEQKPGRHFHCAESLALYEVSLWQWFRPHFRPGNDFLFLTPDAKAAPHSSLVHMCETVRQKTGGAAGPEPQKFFGQTAGDGTWTIEFDALQQTLASAAARRQPVTLLGTAFSFVQWLDFLAANELCLALPPGSQVMETGGYKNRSRVLPKAELHALITRHLGVGRGDIICEYGMSELSSQAYEVALPPPPSHLPPSDSLPRAFHFPPWARVQIISPESGREVAEGESGLIRVLDLANVFSVAAIQTEDLGIRRGNGFELLGRAALAEPRGCSLMTA